jgi:hypothetical protein
MYLLLSQFVGNLASLLKKPVFFVPGNRDLPDLMFAQNEMTNVDCLQGHPPRSLNEISLAGIGGSNWINGMFTYEWREEWAYTTARSHLGNAPLTNCVLVSHCPPFGGQNDVLLGTNRHAGSLAVHRLLADYQPLICVSGHIHESSGVEMIGKTLCINVGSLVAPIRILLEGGRKDLYRKSYSLAERCYRVDIFSVEPAHIRVYQILSPKDLDFEMQINSYELKDGVLSTLPLGYQIGDETIEPSLEKPAEPKPEVSAQEPQPPASE